MSSNSIHASPIAVPCARTLARILLIATAVGLLESLVGTFALHDDPFLARTLYLVVLNWIGAAYGILGYLLARRVGRFHEHFWARVLVADLATFVPQALTVWASTWLVGGRLGPETLWLFLGYTFVLSGAFIAAFIAPILDRARELATSTRLAVRPSFAQRLPFALRSADLWALAAEDHCLRAITSRGQALIRMRLVDAIQELHGIEGARCHRSWWVARASITDVKRADGRLRAVVLRDGTEVPVSRSAAAGVHAMLACPVHPARYAVQEPSSAPQVRPTPHGGKDLQSDLRGVEQRDRIGKAT